MQCNGVGESPVGATVSWKMLTNVVYTLAVSRTEIDSGVEYTLQWKCFMSTLPRFPRFVLVCLGLATGIRSGGRMLA